MGMETLKNAERAAGFAMAAGDELTQDRRQAKADADLWRPGEALLATPKSAPAPKLADWMRGLASLFGRGAPA